MYSSLTVFRRRSELGVPFGVDVSHPDPDSDETLEVEVREPYLDRARIVETRIAREVCVEPLRQRRESLRALRAVIERRRAGDHHVQAGESAAVDLVDELTHRVEALLANVAPYSLKRLDLIQHQHQPGVARVAEDDKQALEKAEGAEVVDLALHARRALDGCGHVRLRTDPGEDPVGEGDVPRGEGGAMCPQRCCERWRAARHLREAALHQLVDAALQLDLVVLGDLPRCEHVLFKRESPPLENGAERSLLHISGRQTLDKSPIDGLESV